MKTIPGSRDRKIHALFGHPIGHSLSPTMFNATYRELGLNREYLAFSVTPEQIERAVEAALALGFDGFNVTIPLKERVIATLDRLEGDAKEAGAVNTVALQSSGLVGYNTDGEGFLRALQTYRFDPAGQSVLILGAGGAARAVVNSLSKARSRVTIVNRTLEKARNIAVDNMGRGEVAFAEMSRASLSGLISNADLVVNATPVNTNRLLANYGLAQDAVPNDTYVFDLAYDGITVPAPETRNSHSSFSPLEMLLQQALLSYQIWMRTPPPDEVMRQALITEIGFDWRPVVS